MLTRDNWGEYDLYGCLAAVAGGLALAHRPAAARTMPTGVPVSC